MYIVTHTKPDMDAVTSCWLLQRFGGFADADVVFVNTGTPDADLLANAAAVVDTGKIHNPNMFCFDHHQDPALPCAAKLVWQHLDYLTVLGENPAGVDLSLLDEMLDLVNAGDWAHADAAESRSLGLHAIYSGGLADNATDAQRLAWGYQLLDAIYATATRKAAGRAALETSTVYVSNDNRLVALRNAPQSASGAALEDGATVVIFADYERNAIGVTRHSEATVNVGELVASVLSDRADDAETDPFAIELARWYRHPAGFFAGRGTGKAPSADPIEVDVVHIARLLDAAWAREAGQ